MVVSIINFFWILSSSFLLGFFLLHIFSKIAEESFRDIDLIIAVGLVGLTVYAEIFSLVHRVGFLANLGVFIANIMILVGFSGEILELLASFFRSKRHRGVLLGIVIIFLYFASMACKTPDFYDTGLYHGQAIRWIEEYGVVKGLGNLHNRLAYNSAFLCLQALFSWKSVLGVSLHGVNAFLGALMTIYALANLLPIKKVNIITLFVDSLILLYIILSLADISSPNTDFSAMLILLYVISKWMHETTKKAPRNIYGMLSIIVIWGITVKLSTVAMILFVFYSFIRYLKKHKWKEILSYGLALAIVAMPFLVRNVMISGFLLYPYTMIDVFNVDWKMPVYTVNFDNHEIVAWGRGLNDVDKYNWPFVDWFKEWFSGLGYWNAFLVTLNIGLVIIALIYLIFTIKKRSISSFGAWGVSIVCLLTWLFSAPLLRYGIVYLYLQPSIVLGILMAKFKEAKVIIWSKILILGMIFCGYMSYLWNLKEISIYYPTDYPHFLCYEAELEGERIYLPTEGDRTGYHAFPATPYSARLNVIEKRGENIEDGFRVKDEYKDLNISTYGDIY